MDPVTKSLRAIRALAGVADDAPRAIRAYHGSPHSFSKFDASRIGSGEGAQAYGHGLYFAGNEAVARSYRDISPAMPSAEAVEALRRIEDRLQELRKNKTKLEYAIEDAATMPSPGWGDIKLPPPDVMNQLRPQLQAVDSELAALGLEQMRVRDGGRGHMYEVEIDYPEEALLDYDRKLTEQPGPVLDYARSLGYRGDMWTGEDLYGDLGRFTPEDIRPGWTSVLNTVNDRVARPQVAAARLMEAGIPGIRYLDQGSRSAGDGTRNYVVFPGAEDRIRILRQYGWMLPLPLAAAGEE